MVIKKEEAKNTFLDQHYAFKSDVYILFYCFLYMYIALVVELGFSLGRYLVGALMEHFLEGSSPLRLRKVSSETLKKQFVFVILLIWG